jgi:hypothetical protein
MKPKYDNVEHFKALISLALEIDDCFDKASHEKCTCGSDPEGACGFCSKWERGERKMEAFKALVERGLGIN